MPFEQGKPKTGGRIKGTPNRITLAIRQAISEALEAEAPNIQKDLQSLSPSQRISAIIKLSALVIPAPCSEGIIWDKMASPMEWQYEHWTIEPKNQTWANTKKNQPLSQTSLPFDWKPNRARISWAFAGTGTKGHRCCFGRSSLILWGSPKGSLYLLCQGGEVSNRICAIQAWGQEPRGTCPFCFNPCRMAEWNKPWHQ